VKGWLIGLGLENYLYIFQDEDTDGRKLVALTETELVEVYKVEKKIARRIIIKRNEIMKLQATEKRNSEKQPVGKPRRMSILKRASLSFSMRNLHTFKEDEIKLPESRSSKSEIKLEPRALGSHTLLSISPSKQVFNMPKLPQHSSSTSNLHSHLDDKSKSPSKADIRSTRPEQVTTDQKALSLEQLTRISVRNALHHNPVARDVCLMLEKLDYVDEWDLQDVLVWLDFVGFSSYKPHFRAANISGKHLLSLTSRDLSKYLKIYDEKDARALANHIRLLNVY